MNKDNFILIWALLMTLLDHHSHLSSGVESATFITLAVAVLLTIIIYYIIGKIAIETILWSIKTLKNAVVKHGR